LLKQAVFLVGGLGSRLGQLTEKTPKPLLKVSGTPFLTHLINKATKLGFTDILLLAGHLGNEIVSYYQKTPVAHANLKVVVEPQPLGTGGALWFARDYLDSRFLLANGDTYFDFNWQEINVGPLAASPAVIALRKASIADRYSEVILDGSRITEFAPPSGQQNCLTNGGVYVLDKEVVPKNCTGSLSLENDIFTQLAAQRRLSGAPKDAFFIDIGIPTDLQLAETEIPKRLSNKAVFFDRDGTLNIDHGYVGHWQNFNWVEGARDAIKFCNDHNYHVFVVTNQSGVARGLYTEADVHDLHSKITEDLATLGAYINRFEYCPHHPEGIIEEYRKSCYRRKPGSGMIESCIDRYDLAPNDCVLFGDQDTDLEAAEKVGIKAYKFSSGSLLELVRRYLEPSITQE
jgi:D,D-heptose 1,7-bisphosphate phosphatase